MKNKIYAGADNRLSLYDLSLPTNWNNKLVIFIHGYMGYKDWGCWNLVSKFFSNQKFGFLKYNVSHNGCTLKAPNTFSDLNAFSINNYSKELKDLTGIIELIKKEHPSSEIMLIGHSRGGGIALLQSKNKDISKICTWAAIASIDTRFPKGKELDEWKNNKIRTIINGRTKQVMPHHIDQYFDYINHTGILDIKKACSTSKTPTCIIHGADDTSVSIKEGEKIAKWLGKPLHTITNTAHTFDSKEPWENDQLPEKLKEACNITLDFFNK